MITGMTAEDDRPQSSWCECVGAPIRHRWHHATNCPRWAPPPAGPGSTPQGRAHARRILDQTRAGCRCGLNIVGRPPDQHLTECPTRRAKETQP